jgi:hypothetical protein
VLQKNLPRTSNRDTVATVQPISPLADTDLSSVTRVTANFESGDPIENKVWKKLGNLYAELIIPMILS